ncbi:GNAT family N-acetyltransferase [Emticicia sp. CRIBPO]|uniref:GNAT family N-acetyltransferase n=1 Tax=Emticicia sp. CRIBPO TaxID=2683258 RepID=UPI00141218B6|nr:GNAT family N-acetyltransferase [Emticicia sp. CRIBPO]NBA88977.1 GNAT family N-acetyltransferase [Emticicia sp. CRIBPO]
MLIQTERLNIFPLTYEQTIKYINNNSTLENELGLQCHKRQVAEDLYEAVADGILPKLGSTTKKLPYHALWIAVERDQKSIVSSFLFKGEPNKFGQVEIGYGSEAGFENKGYMTETLSGAIKWAREQKEIRSIVAETKPQNIASIRVLAKNNFKEINKEDEKIIWRFDVKSRKENAATHQ